MFFSHIYTIYNKFAPNLFWPINLLWASLSFRLNINLFQAMLKFCYWFSPILLIFYSLSLRAQKADSLKKDTIKADTTLLNKLRKEPGKNTLPYIFRPFKLSEELIPVVMPDYKISYWHKWIIFGLNLNQSAFTDNYSAGGVSAVALSSNFDFKAEYTKGTLDYTTELNLIYGISKTKGQGSRKTNDRIFFDNKLATQLSKHWSFFGSLTFESQFTKGYNYNNPDGSVAATPFEISNFMAPGYLTESFGFEYKPVKYFDLRIGVATARQTFVEDTSIYANLPANYGVAKGHTFKNELASQIVAVFDKDIMKNVHLNARYALFIPYQQSLAYVSHRVDATLTAKVNRLVAVTINGTFLYDKNTANAVQGTEGIALGVIYKFP